MTKLKDKVLKSESWILPFLKFESWILPFLKFESRIPGLFEIWIQNPWTPPLQSPMNHAHGLHQDLNILLQYSFHTLPKVLASWNLCEMDRMGIPHWTISAF